MNLSRLEKKEILVRRVNSVASFVNKARWMSVQEIAEVRLMLSNIEEVLVSIENKE